MNKSFYKFYIIDMKYIVKHFPCVLCVMSWLIIIGLSMKFFLHLILLTLPICLPSAFTIREREEIKAFLFFFYGISTDARYTKETWMMLKTPERNFMAHRSEHSRSKSLSGGKVDVSLTYERNRTKIKNVYNW